MRAARRAAALAFASCAVAIAVACSSFEGDASSPGASADGGEAREGDANAPDAPSSGDAGPRGARLVVAGGSKAPEAGGKRCTDAVLSSAVGEDGTVGPFREETKLPSRSTRCSSRVSRRTAVCRRGRSRPSGS